MTLLICFALLALCSSAEATLIITLYDHGTFYIASDSLESSFIPRDSPVEKSPIQKTAQKLFQASSNSCICLSGYYGPQIIATNTGEVLGSHLRMTVERVCKILNPSPAALQDRVQFLIYALWLCCHFAASPVTGRFPAL